MNNKYQKITYAIMGAVLGLAMSSSLITSALAANPHGPTQCSVSQSSFALTCSGDIRGLGNTQSGTMSATFTGFYSCTGTGIPIPAQPIGVAGNQGQVHFEGTIPAPSASSANCNPTLTDAEYCNIVVTFKNSAGDTTGTLNLGCADSI